MAHIRTKYGPLPSCKRILQDLRDLRKEPQLGQSTAGGSDSQTSNDMKTDNERESAITNIVRFRLTGTPDGNLLVTFFYLDIFNEMAVNRHIAGQLLGGQLGARVLYEGNLQNNTHYPSAIVNLLQRVEIYVNCVRIEKAS